MLQIKPINIYKGQTRMQVFKYIRGNTPVDLSTLHNLLVWFTNKKGLVYAKYAMNPLLGHDSDNFMVEVEPGTYSIRLQADMTHTFDAGIVRHSQKIFKTSLDFDNNTAITIVEEDIFDVIDNSIKNQVI